MIAFSAEILVSVIMFCVGVVAGMEMYRAAQGTINRGRSVDTAPKGRHSLLILVASLLVGVLVLPHFPSNINMLIWLPFAGGMALAILFLAVQRRTSPR